MPRCIATYVRLVISSFSPTQCIAGTIQEGGGLHLSAYRASHTLRFEYQFRPSEVIAEVSEVREGDETEERDGWGDKCRNITKEIQRISPSSQTM